LKHVETNTQWTPRKPQICTAKCEQNASTWLNHDETLGGQLQACSNLVGGFNPSEKYESQLG